MAFQAEAAFLLAVSAPSGCSYLGSSIGRFQGAGAPCCSLAALLVCDSKEAGDEGGERTGTLQGSVLLSRRGAGTEGSSPEPSASGL